MKVYILYHIIGFLIGFVLDLIIGDPHSMPHPIRLIGKMISYLDKSFRKGMKTSDEGYNSRTMRMRGFFLWLCVSSTAIVVVGIVTIVSYMIHPYFGVAIEGILTFYCLAAHSLKKESMVVYYALKNEGLEAGRYAVSMIVGRDTDLLDETGVIKAAVETIAENTSDGVIAPMLYLAIGGPIAGMLYKAVNTMDSMIGYHNDKYEDLGFFAAKADDIFNYIPARLTATLTIVMSCMDSVSFDPVGARDIYKRDKKNHKSPNSACSESAFAGALGLKLAGDAYYFGKLVSKPYIGDEVKPICLEDIKRANRLMYRVTFLMEGLSVLALGICWLW